MGHMGHGSVRVTHCHDMAFGDGKYCNGHNGAVMGRCSIIYRQSVTRCMMMMMMIKLPILACAEKPEGYTFVYRTKNHELKPIYKHRFR